MNILKTATDWTKAEMLSSAFFILFGIGFLLAAFGFLQIGKTDTARAFVVPGTVAGILLLIIGGGIFVLSYGRIASFEAAYTMDPTAFVAAEFSRAESVLRSYETAVFWVMPMIVALSAALLPFVESPAWRAPLITTIAMMAVLLLVDTNASARLADYKTKLMQVAN